MMTRPTYLQRLLQEHADLSLRIDKLQTFIGTTTYANLPEQDKTLLNRQLDLMVSLEKILDSRIKRSEEAAKTVSFYGAAAEGV